VIHTEKLSKKATNVVQTTRSRRRLKWLTSAVTKGGRASVHLIVSSSREQKVIISTGNCWLAMHHPFACSVTDNWMPACCHNSFVIIVCFIVCLLYLYWAMFLIQHRPV